MMITQYLLMEETWFIVGMVLIILDISVGLQFFALSFGLGSMCTGVLIYLSEKLGQMGFPVIETWTGALFSFAAFSLVLLLPIRKYLYRGAECRGDINEY
jgi:membrane protein implicated in regulation of membrane protease activity